MLLDQTIDNFAGCGQTAESRLFVLAHEAAIARSIPYTGRGGIVYASATKSFRFDIAESVGFE
jgi:hypothetical protein